MVVPVVALAAGAPRGDAEGDLWPVVWGSISCVTRRWSRTR
jgi:hypothetical protein